jgi:hypothetical protein
MTSKNYREPTVGQGFEQSSGITDLSHLATGDNAPFAGSSQSGGNTTTGKTTATGGAVGSESPGTAIVPEHEVIPDVFALDDNTDQVTANRLDAHGGDA